MSTPRFPAGRYGRRRRPRRSARWLVPVLTAGVVLAGVGVAGWLYRTHVADRVQSGVMAYTIRSDHQVDITFEVRKRAGQPATCVLRARARDGREVGRTEVAVPAAPASAVLTHTLRTRARAVTGEVHGCSPGRPR